MKKIGFIIILFLNLIFVFGGEQDAILKLRQGNNPGYYSGRMYCETPINIFLDSPNQTTAIQVYVDFNQNEISPVGNRENNFRPSYPLLPSTNIPEISYVGNTGRLDIANSSYNVSQRRNGLNGLIGSFRITNKTGITQSSLFFYVINFSTGQTAGDSTISRADGGWDLLSGVENLSINFQTGPCLIDNKIPILQNLNIASGAYRVDLQNINITYSLDDVSNTGYHYEISGGNYIPTTTKDNQYGVNLQSIENIVSGSNSSGYNYKYNDTNINIISNGQTTREEKDRGFDIELDISNRFPGNMEEMIQLYVSGADNVGNKITHQMSFNKARHPFVRRSAKSDRDGNIGLSNPFFGDVPSKKPDSLYFVRKDIPEIKFAVVDDRAGIDSGSLYVTLRKGSIHGTIIRAYTKSDMFLTRFSTTYLKDNSMTGSNNITHNNNFYITIGGFGDLPEGEQIFVVVSGYDLSPSKTRFVSSNTDFPDQVNYFSFFVKGSCESMQCREDTVIINITGSDEIYTGAKLYISGNAFISLSGNELSCGKSYTGFEIMSGEDILIKYTGDQLIIKGSGFTTTLSGNMLYVNLSTPYGQVIATPNLGAVPLETNFTLSDIDYSRIVIKKVIFGDGNEIIPNTGQTIFSHTYTGAGVFTARVELANKYDNNKTGQTQAIITVLGSCGNGIIESPEQCDGTNFSGQSCNNFGFNAGSLTCNSCTISTQNCTITTPATCGDGIRQGSEVCDLNDFEGRDCEDYGYEGGYLTCRASCTISTQNCTIRHGGGGGGGGGQFVKDNCPQGDYSPSYYDNKCGTKPHAAPEKTGEITPPPPVKPKCEIVKSPYGAELTEAFKRAYSAGITTICPIEKANLKGLLLRKHMAKMISSFAIEIVGLSPNYRKEGCKFNDIAKESEEMRHYMKLSCQLGLMGLKYDGTSDIKFNPNNYVTRAQFGTILSRLIWGNKYNGNPANRYINHLKALQQAGIMKIIHTPKMQEVRGFVLIMLHRTFKSGILHTGSLSRPLKEVLDSFFSKY